MAIQVASCAAWSTGLNTPWRQARPDELRPRRSGDRLHAWLTCADVGPDRVVPRRGDLGDLGRLRVDDLVTGVGEPAGSAVDPRAHVRVDSQTAGVSDDGHPDRPVDRRSPAGTVPASRAIARATASSSTGASTGFVRNGGTVKRPQAIARRAQLRTTKPYRPADGDDVTAADIEKIGI